ncbi:MAG: gamma-glutamyl-gamma-aminobutyrate hydrolase family protein [Ginsengibacter sp.]
MKRIVVGIGEGSKYHNYENWIKEEPGVEVIKLSYRLDNINEIERCDGIILTGGGDVDPQLYHRPDFLPYTDPNDVDVKRDEFEWKIMQHIDEKQKPLLGICRGLQVANVYFGGVLVPDIPSFGKFNHSGFKEGNDREHAVGIDPNSELYQIAGEEKGWVNSAHHQSVDTPGAGLVVNALSPDGIVEGMERKEKNGKAYLMLVQWHPERMINQDSGFSRKIKQSFLNAIREKVDK